jgi:hypothetical protein
MLKRSDTVCLGILHLFFFEEELKHKRKRWITLLPHLCTAAKGAWYSPAIMHVDRTFMSKIRIVCESGSVSDIKFYDVESGTLLQSINYLKIDEMSPNSAIVKATIGLVLPGIDMLVEPKLSEETFNNLKLILDIIGYDVVEREPKKKSNWRKSLMGD